MTSKRYAIVTPYYKESRRILDRCLGSVRRQTLKADHIIIADGFAQDWLEGEPVRHIKLDRSHGDYGNAARGVGALLAVSEEYDGIGFLDADNWFADDHIERCVEAAVRLQECDFIVARRYLTRPDETILATDDESPAQHVDTNCFFFLKGAFHALHYWLTIPRELSIAADRVFYIALKKHNLRSVLVEKITVFYEYLWSGAYLAKGEQPPPGVKAPIDPVAIFDWLQSRSDRELQLVNRLSGEISWRSLHISMARNAQCPCGSGKLFRHCHGISAA